MPGPVVSGRPARGPLELELVLGPDHTARYRLYIREVSGRRPHHDLPHRPPHARHTYIFTDLLAVICKAHKYLAGAHTRHTHTTYTHTPLWHSAVLCCCCTVHCNTACCTVLAVGLYWLCTVLAVCCTGFKLLWQCAVSTWFGVCAHC